LRTRLIIKGRAELLSSDLWTAVKCARGSRRVLRAAARSGQPQSGAEPCNCSGRHLEGAGLLTKGELQAGRGTTPPFEAHPRPRGGRGFPQRMSKQQQGYKEDRTTVGTVKASGLFERFLL
jgi:hypothetical protein